MSKEDCSKYHREKRVCEDQCHGVAHLKSNETIARHGLTQCKLDNKGTYWHEFDTSKCAHHGQSTQQPNDDVHDLIINRLGKDFVQVA